MSTASLERRRENVVLGILALVGVIGLAVYLWNGWFLALLAVIAGMAVLCAVQNAIWGSPPKRPRLLPSRRADVPECIRERIRNRFLPGLHDLPAPDQPWLN